MLLLGSNNISATLLSFSVILMPTSFRYTNVQQPWCNPWAMQIPGTIGIHPFQNINTITNVEAKKEDSGWFVYTVHSINK
jgi:hypothetical protein